MEDYELKRFEELREIFEGGKELTPSQKKRMRELKTLWEEYKSSRDAFEEDFSFYKNNQCIDYQQQFNRLREARKLTLEEVADKAKVSKKSLSAYNAGTKSPSIGAAMAICMALNLDIKSASTLLSSLGVCLIASRKEHAAYLYLLEKYRGKDIKTCNNVLRYLGIDNRFLLETVTKSL